MSVLVLVVILLFVFGVIDLNDAPTGPSTSVSPTSAAIQGFAGAVGSWESTDPVDGSYQTLTVTALGNDRYRMVLYDEGATSCGTDDEGNALVGAEITGSGRTQNTLLSLAEAEVFCLFTPRELYSTIYFELSYSSGSDTLTDNWDSTWDRIR